MAFFPRRCFLAEARELVPVVNESSVRTRPDLWAQGRIAVMIAKATPEQRKPLSEVARDVTVRSWPAQTRGKRRNGASAIIRVAALEAPQIKGGQRMGLRKGGRPRAGYRLDLTADHRKAPLVRPFEACEILGKGEGSRVGIEARAREDEPHPIARGADSRKQAPNEECDLGAGGAAVEMRLVEDDDEFVCGIRRQPLCGGLEYRALDRAH